VDEPIHVEGRFIALKDTLDFKIYLKRKAIALKGFCNADWVEDVNNQRSAIGYVFLIGIGVISWKCKKQPIVASSTMEAEYMSTSHCMKEAVWLMQFLADMRYMHELRTKIHHV